MFDIQIWDTREDVVGVVRGVPGATVSEAAQAVCKKRGYRYVGAVDGLDYAVHLDVYKDWNHCGFEGLEADIAAVLAGETDEMRGLFQLFEHDVPEETFEPATAPDVSILKGWTNEQIVKVIEDVYGSWKYQDTMTHSSGGSPRLWAPLNKEIVDVFQEVYSKE